MPKESRRRRQLFSAIGTLLLVGTVVSLTGASPASAQDLRSELPIVAGTRLEVPGMRQCTVGAVLRSTSIFSRLTAFSRGKRYLLIAKHCAPDGADIKVGGQSVGKVIWTAPSDDLELVQVDPNFNRQVVCQPGSVHRCTIVEHVYPRAFGRVFLAPNGRPRTIPMTASSVPGGDERFCTSGSSTGVNCSWSTAPTPRTGFAPGEAAASHTQGIGVIAGDSGGPVVGANGQFYGIIVTRGIGPLLGLMGYIPSSRALSAVGSYEIAPPN
nr:hypothetical protein PCFP21_255 [Curtobacterium flaccumfaciens pv. poinsettiae]WQM79199.1 hypothetical protein PCFP23_250 [Curtobacterium flaccumfaciens pv. poinsettiae]WQM79337.1 hypothetical protein PCFP24_435 [Curtobacterium flaccumfaciens pv. poinsettiae]WQM79412.1 hypothetical protein PCFP11_325 [Curtobacterium flaccumfaciens pv. poinsettiae]WQM79447.1 hypothetical protein PCFP31_065 [Curtobacterium flaccumfaciens pv. poinsettiae]